MDLSILAFPFRLHYHGYVPWTIYITPKSLVIKIRHFAWLSSFFFSSRFFLLLFSPFSAYISLTRHFKLSNYTYSFVLCFDSADRGVFESPVSMDGRNERYATESTRIIRSPLLTWDNEGHLVTFSQLARLMRRQARCSPLLSWKMIDKSTWTASKSLACLFPNASIASDMQSENYMSIHDAFCMETINVHWESTWLLRRRIKRARQKTFRPFRFDRLESTINGRPNRYAVQSFHFGLYSGPWNARSCPQWNRVHRQNMMQMNINCWPNSA